MNRVGEENTNRESLEDIQRRVAAYYELPGERAPAQQPRRAAVRRDPPHQPAKPQYRACPFCRETIPTAAKLCSHCGSRVAMAARSSVGHGILAMLASFLFLPLGFWYKGQYAVGFAWLVVSIVFFAVGGWMLGTVAYVIGVIHAAAISPKG